MTDTSTIPTWPAVKATTRPDGTGELTINGTSYPIETPSAHAARQEIIRRVVDTAAKLNRPVHVTTSGPEGDWPIIIHPDGTIEPDPRRPAPANRGRQPATTPPLPASAGVSPDEPGPQQTVVDDALVDDVDDALVEEQAVSQQPAEAEVGPWAQEAPVRPAGPAQEPAQPRSRLDPTAAPDQQAIPRRSFLSQDEVEDPARYGWRGFLTRIGIRMTPDAHERSERTDVQAVSQHWPGPRTIAVVNGKGGASKTPSTILLSAVFARYGGAGVLAWDNNQTRGTLGWRTEQGPHEATLLDLLPETGRLLSTSAQSADLAHFVHHQTRDRFDVLRSKPMVLADEQRVEPADVDAIWRVAAKYYRLILMDSGNDEADPMWLRMIDHTDQLVVVTTTRDDHAEAGALLLEALAQRDERSAHLAGHAVAVISQADPKSTAADLRHIAQGYRNLTREVVAIPHDPAIVDGILRHGSLRPTTQRAWLAAGAAVARGL